MPTPITRQTTGANVPPNYTGQDVEPISFTHPAAPLEGEVDVLIPYTPPVRAIAAPAPPAQQPAPGTQDTPIDLTADGAPTPARHAPLARVVDVVTKLECMICRSDCTGAGVRLCINPNCTSTICIDCMHARPYAEVPCGHNCYRN